jgi:hypothetical protein
MGLLDRFIKKAMPGGADDYGSIPVPGSAELELPAGTVRLTYQESKRSRNEGTEGQVDIEFSAPGDLQLTVTPVGGGAPLDITAPGALGMGSRKSTTFGISRDEIGTVEVPVAGSYTVAAKTATTIVDAVIPQVLIGS